MRRHRCFEYVDFYLENANLGKHENDGNEDKGFTRKTIVVHVRQWNFGTFLSGLLQNNYSEMTASYVF